MSPLKGNPSFVFLANIIHQFFSVTYLTVYLLVQHSNCDMHCVFICYALHISLVNGL